VDANVASSYYDKAITDQFVVNSKGERLADHEPLEIDLRLEIAKQDNEMLLPVYVGKNASGKKTYIFPVHGKGLWGAVWGYIALREDLNTIDGVYFDHAKETPGLGAEIADAEFQDQFKQKRLFDDAQQFQSVSVLKNTGDADNPHSVQALSGATITSRGVSNMLRDNMRYYLPFIQQEKKQNN
jgi:Na+-transporting NADH:ubiquinone oxidoreductase subunit C